MLRGPSGWVVGEEAPGPGPRGRHGNPQGCGHKGLRTVLAQSPEVPPLGLRATEKRLPQGEHWWRARRDPGPCWVLLASRAHGDPRQLTEKIKQVLCVDMPLLSPLLRPLDLELLVLGDHSSKGQILGV